MTPDEIIAVKWLFNPPILNQPAVRQYPTDPILSVYRPICLHALPVIRRRSIEYRKAGCPGDACVKSALRDYFGAVDSITK